MNKTQRNERVIDRLVGRRQLLNWRWWVALVPVVFAIVVFHVTATICQACADAADWASFRWFRAGCKLMLWCKYFTTLAHGWVFPARVR